MSPIDASIYRAQEPVQSPLKGISDALVVRGQQQAAEINQFKLDEARRAEQTRRTLSQAIINTPMIDEDGASVYDIASITKKLPPDASVEDVVKHLDAINNSFRSQQTHKKAVIAQGATALLASGSDPELTLHFIDGLEKNQSVPKETLDTYRAFIQAHPDQIPAILQQLIPPQKVETAAAGSSARNPLTGQIIPGSTVPPNPTRANLAVQAAAGDANAEKALGLMASQSEKSLQTKSVLLDGKPAEVIFHPDTGKYTKPDTGEDVSGRVRPIPPASASVNVMGALKPGALDQAAQKYIDTGVLPSVGYGAAAAQLKTAIMNRANDLDPKAALARNAATYKADSANLTNLQKTEGTLSSFERTASSNLDQFLSLAEKIPDTGVPWLNTPVRRLTVNVVGQENMAAINAARDVALREIARVTNDPKLSGALTDTARREVAGLSPENATLPQIKAVVKVLKKDMANVHSALNEEIATVKKTLSSNAAAPEANPKDPMGLR